MENKFFVINVNEPTLRKLEHHKSLAFKLINDKTTIYKLNNHVDSNSLDFAQISILYTPTRFNRFMAEMVKIEAVCHLQFCSLPENSKEGQ